MAAAAAILRALRRNLTQLETGEACRIRFPRRPPARQIELETLAIYLARVTLGCKFWGL
jgi:hypothetical protein